MAVIIIFLIFGSIGLVFLIVLYKGINLLFGDQLTHLLLYFKRNNLSRIERNGIERIIQKKVPYFKHLSPSGKSKFISRLTNHFVHKSYEGREGQAITREIKVLISAAATQLTFGLRYSFLNHFDTYVIYPKRFQLSKKYPEMYGATIPNGTIVFSSNKLEEGFDDYSDGVNLGIHEFCHALVIQHKVGVASEMDWQEDYNNWFHSTFQLLKQADREKKEYFRRDVLKVPTEMFPIMVEEFFERPGDFHTAFPHIYISLVRLLNQNPIRISQDYRPIKTWGYYS